MKTTIYQSCSGLLKMSTPHFEHLAIPTRYIPPSNAITGSHTGRELSAKGVQIACLKAARPHRKMCQFLRGDLCSSSWRGASCAVFLLCTSACHQRDRWARLGVQDADMCNLVGSLQPTAFQL